MRERRQWKSLNKKLSRRSSHVLIRMYVRDSVVKQSVLQPFPFSSCLGLLPFHESHVSPWMLKCSSKLKSVFIACLDRPGVWTATRTVARCRETWYKYLCTGKSLTNQGAVKHPALCFSFFVTMEILRHCMVIAGIKAGHPLCAVLGYIA